MSISICYRSEIDSFHQEYISLWKILNQGGCIEMKTLVTYFTDSGNTKKVAEAIFDAIEGEKEIFPIGDVEALEGYDLIFVGSPMHGFGLNENIKEFIEAKAKGRNIALFVTHASPEEAEEQLRPWLENCKKEAAGANLVGFFNCQGEMHKDLADHMMKMDDPRMVKWGSHRHMTLGQPDETRLERARFFARDVMSKLG
jgi:flavodoxin